MSRAWTLWLCGRIRHLSVWQGWVGDKIDRTSLGVDQIKNPPDLRLHKTLHKNLHKAESSMLIQLRTGRTGFRHFPAQGRSPRIRVGTVQLRDQTPQDTSFYTARMKQSAAFAMRRLKVANWISLAFWTLPKALNQPAGG